MQVLRVVKALSHVAKFRARAAMGGPNRAALRRTLKDSPVDLLVGTPGAVGKLLDNKLIYLSRVKAVVVDEADALLSEKGGFADQTLPIVDALGRREGVQFVYAGATIPARVQADIKGKHDKLAVVRGEQLHKATSAANLKTTFIRVAGGEDAKFAKAIEIAEKALLQKGGADRLLIFCDERERREKLVDLLREYTGANIVHLCGRNDYQERQRDWESFLGNTVDGEQARIAVCAKSFGRGVDHHGIGTVLLVDVPWTGAEYLHRVGRIRGSGKVFVLVGNREEAVAEALFLGHVKGERLVSIQPRSAWKGYTNAGKDRITSEPAVNYAKRKSQAKWIDERPRAVGTARSGVGNAVLQRPNEDERAHWARHAFARRDQRVRMAPSSASGRWHKSSKKRMGREQKHERGGRMGKFRTTIASNW